MNAAYQSITPLYGEFYWESPASDELLQVQLAFRNQLKLDFDAEIQEIRMGFSTLAVRWKTPVLSSIIESWLILSDIKHSLQPLDTKCWEIPVCYSESKGKDLKILAESKNMSLDELIFAHATPHYRIHFFGFLPGFMYLNGLPKILHTPRKTIPDRQVPAGSVAIGAGQTGIYPSPSPGGWHLIGTSPLSFFDTNANNPVWAKPGELIIFNPITSREFDHLIRHPKTPKFK